MNRFNRHIIIEIFGGNERVREHLKNQGNKVFGITSVTEFELFCGDLKEKEVIMLDRLETCDFERHLILKKRLRQKYE